MTAQKHLTGRAWAELMLLGTIWGGVFLSVRLALDELPVATLVLHRTFWAMLVLWAVVAWRRLPLPRDPRVWRDFAIMGLLNNALPFALLTWGQQYIESGLASILNATTAVFGVVVAALLFADERLTWTRGLGVALGFLGVATALGLDSLRAFDLRSGAQLACLAATFCYALAGSWARARLSGLPPQVAAAGMLTGSTAILLPVALLLDGVPRFDLAPLTWGAIGYYAVIATALAYLLYYRVLAMAGSGNLMLVTLVIPPVAICLGALVLGEALHPRHYAGFALLALGLMVLRGRVPLPIDRLRRAH